MKQLSVTEARTARKWTLSELAERAGLNKGTVSRIESGEISNPSNATVARLELALRLKRGTLVFGHEPEARTA
jgi:transcriptional regulator with XRE-family HTH domain